MSTGDDSAFMWTCPVCGRRVPRRVDTCFCGLARTQADGYAASRRRKAKASLRPGDLALLGIAAGVLAVAAIALLRSTAEVPAVAPTPAAAVPVPPAPERGVVLGAAPVASATPVPPAAPPAFAPPMETLAAAPASRPPAPSPPSNRPEAEDPRTVARRELEERLGVVARHAAELARLQGDYERACVGMPFGTAVSNCAEVQASLRRRADDLSRELEEAEDAARRGWLPPGAVREAREQLGLDASRVEALLRVAREAGRH